MPKNFRHHSTNANVQHWETVDAYGHNEIAAMPDPAGLRTGKPITSIPSPFARLDLVKAAFSHIAHHDTITPGYLEGEKDGMTGIQRPNDYHRLVSEALDLAQMLFEYDALRKHLSLSFWDRSEHLPGLKTSSWPGVRLLGETLDMFLTRDGTTNNFNDQTRLYFIKYNHRIIGGTSPKTLFFTTANSLSFVDVTFSDGHRAFQDVRALHQRDPEFVEFIFLFFRMHGLAASMPEMNSYLVRTQTNFSPDFVNKLVVRQATPFLVQYDTVMLPGAQVEILGAYYGKKRLKPETITAASDFVINSPKYRRTIEAHNTAKAKTDPSLQMPLALFGARKPLQYTASAKWDVNQKVEPYDSRPLNERTLPGVSVEYPYLTVSDFLQPYLIKTVFPIDKRKWFDGNLSVESGSDKQGYLLPLSELFFKFFDAADLVDQQMHDGKPFFEMTQIPRGGVRATLRVPLQKEREYVEFTRLYEPSSESEVTPPEDKRNKGIILTNQFSLTLFPFLKPTDPPSDTAEQSFLTNVYRVQLVEQDFDPRFVKNNYQLSFFNNDFNTNVRYTGRTRTPLVLGKAGTHYYKIEDRFDLIQVKTQHATAFILPRWETRKSGNQKFRFAIDFGTTNSHVEYIVDDSGQSRPLEITKEEDIQIATLFDDTATSSDFGGSGANLLRDKVVREFLPTRIGGNSEYNFPIRTIVQEGQQVNFGQGADALMELNLGFVYDRNYEETQDSRFYPNLKWSSPKDAGNPQRVQALFDELMFLLRNKTLLSGGALHKTELVWFYPASMKSAQLNNIRGFVHNAFRKYISEDESNIRELSESVAPFYYYTNTAGSTSGLNVTASNRPAVSVDIGGGTTDVVVFNEIWQKSSSGTPVSDLRPRLTTSFRFAGNALFGTGFVAASSAMSNGFVRKYLDYFSKALGVDPRLGVPAQLLAKRLEASSAEEVNNFLFTLETNPEVKRAFNNPALLSYNTILSQDADMKLLFLYFYVAIVYHIAGMMKQRGQKMPGYILFSGTASKVIEILSSSDYTITELTQRILERVYGETYLENERFEVRREKKNPKELTCKGGLLMNSIQMTQLSGGNIRQLQQRMQAINQVYVGIEPKGGATPTPGELLEEQTLEMVVKAVEQFHAFLLDLHQDFDFSDNIGVSKEAIKLFRKEANLGLQESLLVGLSQRLSREEEVKLEESPFFYPLAANLVRLSLQLATLNPVAQS